MGSSLGSSFSTSRARSRGFLRDRLTVRLASRLGLRSRERCARDDPSLAARLEEKKDRYRVKALTRLPALLPRYLSATIYYSLILQRGNSGTRDPAVPRIFGLVLQRGETGIQGR